MIQPTFFTSPARFRTWLEQNHERVSELLIVFHRVKSGKGGLSYREALDEALCFGWIDGLRRRCNATSYTVRFSPRIAGSIWSVINTNRMQALIELGRVHPSGKRTFEQRDKQKSKLYSYEVRNCCLEPAFERQFRSNLTAWEFYQSQAPWYRRVSCYWVMSAKKEETRQRRLRQLITDSAHGRRIKQLISNSKQANPAGIKEPR
jgi:uncharacterized protein YdeI (YjbR/CyaY-like superfamily)